MFILFPLMLIPFYFHLYKSIVLILIVVEEIESASSVCFISAHHLCQLYHYFLVLSCFVLFDIFKSHCLCVYAVWEFRQTSFRICITGLPTHIFFSFIFVFSCLFKSLNAPTIPC